MLGKLGNKNFTLLSKLMSLHSQSHKVVASNIANVNTPNYRRRELSFDTALAQALQNRTASDYRAIQGHVTRPNTTPVRNNGNNVDIDREMMALGRNASSYEMYGHIYNRKSQMLKSAIRGGR